jgi:hypothetical protein
MPNYLNTALLIASTNLKSCKNNNRLNYHLQNQFKEENSFNSPLNHDYVDTNVEVDS